MAQRTVYIVQGLSEEDEVEENNWHARIALEQLLTKLDITILNPCKTDDRAKASKLEELPKRVEKLVKADFAIFVGPYGVSPYSIIEWEIVKQYDIPYCFDHYLKALYAPFDDTKSCLAFLTRTLP